MLFMGSKLNTSGTPGTAARCNDTQYEFDRVYQETATTREVFEGSVEKFVAGLLDGFSLTVFAYGATGSGKTYTMSGNGCSQAGINTMTVCHLYALIEQLKDKEANLSVSYLEVYNETILDLLVPKSPQNRPLVLCEDPLTGATVRGLTWRPVDTVEDVLGVQEEGQSRRVQAGTLANEASSRSHAVLQLCIRVNDRSATISAEVKEARLSLVDLAGSERAAVSENQGLRRKEGVNINSSLLALGNCINALAEKKKRQHVPFRNSKLTRMLKECLGGTCRSVMIAAVSPSSMCYEDTFNTLRYADRAKNIRVKPECRVSKVSIHVAEYKQVIESLRKEVAELRAQMNTAPAPPAAPSPVVPGESVTELLNELSGLMDQQLQLRKDILALTKARQANAVNIRKQALTLFRWKHGLTRDRGPEPASIIHIRNLLEACHSKEETVNNDLNQLLQNLEKKECEYRHFVDRIPWTKFHADQKTVLELKVQLHERTMEYYDQVFHCAEARTGQQLQAQASEEAQLALSETREYLEGLFLRLEAGGSLSETLHARHREARAWFSLPTIDLVAEITAALPEGDASPPHMPPALGRAVVYMNTLQNPTRRLSATSHCSGKLPTKMQPPAAPRRLTMAPSRPSGASKPSAPARPSDSFTAPKTVAAAPRSFTRLQAERERRKLSLLQNTPMLPGRVPDTLGGPVGCPPPPPLHGNPRASGPSSTTLQNGGKEAPGATIRKRPMSGSHEPPGSKKPKTAIKPAPVPWPPSSAAWHCGTRSPVRRRGSARRRSDGAAKLKLVDSTFTWASQMNSKVPTRNMKCKATPKKAMYHGKTGPRKSPKQTLGTRNHASATSFKFRSPNECYGGKLNKEPSPLFQVKRCSITPLARIALTPAGILQAGSRTMNALTNKTPKIEILFDQTPPTALDISIDGNPQFAPPKSTPQSARLQAAREARQQRRIEAAKEQALPPS